eukprot:761471-Hanusia_phi.AAC.5
MVSLEQMGRIPFPAPGVMKVHVRRVKLLPEPERESGAGQGRAGQGRGERGQVGIEGYLMLVGLTFVRRGRREPG